jgi:hypothetical protein
MWQAYAYAKTFPDCSKYAISCAVGPHGSVFYGWRIVQRCLAAGILMAVADDGRYKVRAVPLESLTAMRCGRPL